MAWDATSNSFDSDFPSETALVHTQLLKSGDT